MAQHCPTEDPGDNVDYGIYNTLLIYMTLCFVGMILLLIVLHDNE